LCACPHVYMLEFKPGSHICWVYTLTTKCMPPHPQPPQNYIETGQSDLKKNQEDNLEKWILIINTKN
jgi:hypothetical protein